MVNINVYVNGRHVVQTAIDAPVDARHPMRYIAAAPIGRTYSYHGSGLPFPNYAHAFENTPNKGQVAVVASDGAAGTCEIRLDSTPNSFYAGGGRVLVHPTLYVSFISTAGGGQRKEYSIRLFDALRHKLLNYPRTRTSFGPSFYGNNGSGDIASSLPIRSQENVLRDGAADVYPKIRRVRADPRRISGEGVEHIENPLSSSPFDFWGTKPAV